MVYAPAEDEDGPRPSFSAKPNPRWLRFAELEAEEAETSFVDGRRETDDSNELCEATPAPDPAADRVAVAVETFEFRALGAPPGPTPAVVAADAVDNA